MVVSQCSVLRPLLKIIMYDGILISYPEGCVTVAYADKLALLMKDEKGEQVGWPESGLRTHRLKGKVRIVDKEVNDKKNAEVFGCLVRGISTRISEK